MSCRRILRSASLVGVVVACGFFARQVMAEDPPKLSYGFQKDREYLYNVKIVADLPDEELTREGVYTCKITDAADSQFTLQASGNLAEHVKRKPGAAGSFGRSPFPPIPPHRFGPPGRFPRFGEPVRPAGTTIGRQGNLIIEGKLTPLPFLLGYAEMLFVEPFPKEAKAAWDTQTGLGVIERNQSSWHHIGPFSETEVAHGATERIDFSVQETTPETARITKKYALHTAPEAGAAMQIDMTGNGEFEFDRKEGVIKSQTMKYDIRLAQKNVTITVPFTFDFRLLSDSEAAAYKKKIADAAVAAAEAAKPRPLAGGATGERAQLLKDLQSGDARRIQAAAQRLSKSIRDDNPEAVSRALCRAMKVSDQWTQPTILQALKIWATADAEKTIIAAAKNSSPFLNGPAIEALVNFKSEAAAEVAGAALADLQTRHNAAVALKAMGPIAEPYVIPFANSHDVFVRKEAWNVLAAIGGKQSLGVLKGELANAAWHEKDELQKIIGTIESRLEAGADDVADTSPATTKTPAASETDSAESKTRTWHDATGTFTVEATLVRSANGKVTLKRTDGKEVTLPVSKLSAEDRAFVEKQPKPVNPFE
ncbi:MAG: SHD1 domain-containing protein [Thermoguttaceae bacterium]